MLCEWGIIPEDYYAVPIRIRPFPFQSCPGLRQFLRHFDPPLSKEQIHALTRLSRPI